MSLEAKVQELEDKIASLEAIAEKNRLALEEAQKKLQEAQAEAEKQKGIADNAEKLVQRWSNEVGELRKQVKEAVDKYQALLASIGGKAPEDLNSGPSGGKNGDATADEIEASLTEEQKRAVEQVYASADEETKLRFHQDEQFRKQFLLEAKQRVREVPASPWDKPGVRKRADESGSSGGDAMKVAELFDRVLRGYRAVPVATGTATAASLYVHRPQGRLTVTPGGRPLLEQLQDLRGRK